MNFEIEAPLRLHTEKHIATLLSISIKKLQHDRQLGRGLPFYRIGRSVRYDEVEVRKFLSKNRHS